MIRKQKSFGVFVTILGALLLSPTALRAQEATATETPVVKLAIELGAPFRDDAVLQREMKLPVWGWSKPETKVTVEFSGQKKSATAGKDGKWMLDLDPLKASFEPATMTLTESSGKSVTLKNILVGEVWFASGQSNMQWPASKCDVGLLQKQIASRMMTRKSKEGSSPRPRRFNVSTSNSLDSRFASVWEDADGFAAALGQRIAAKTGQPVGIVLMQSASGKDSKDAELKHWIAGEGLNRAPSLMADFEQLESVRPGTKQYEAEVGRYLNAWKKYWGEYIPALMTTYFS